tara:strand:- start:1122 stop:1841 length:720 start_codon:yes stop_codon:yes gene_type:complete
MTKLCPRGKAAAKRKFKVYPSAYANAYASKICAGKIKDPSGTKRKDFKGPKPAGANEGTFIKAPKPPRATKQKGPRRLSTDYIKKKRAYDELVGNKKSDRRIDPRIRPGAKKGAMMIIIGIGKKKKVDKKMMGGMPTAGAMSGMGRLQKAQMNKGGDAKIKKVITGLNKASALHKGQAKSLQSIVKKSKGGGADYMNTVKAKKRGNPAVVGSPPKKRSGGGMVRGFGAAIRGKNFEGVF